VIVEGIVQGHRDGYGIVVTEGQADVYLPPQQMRGVLHLDRVRVRVVRQDRRGRAEGQLIEIVERSARPVIGRLLHENGVWLLAPEDRRYAQDIMIEPGGLAAAKAGQVVSVELTSAPLPAAQLVGRVVEVLGALHDPGLEIEIAVRKYGVPHRFSDAAERQAAKLPSQVRAADHAGRWDLTDVPLVTIDGEDARDFDDAVYCEPARVGRRDGWRLLVAIADVSHYVRPGDALDADALDRATSVYFPRRVIPMLPEKLSNGLCSLNPDVERLCMVCDMLVDADGEVKAYQFFPAVMRSHARLTYTQVAAMLENTRGTEALARAPLLPHLLNLYDVFLALLKSRRVRGAIDLEVPETQIVCDASGRIERIALRSRNDAHRLIEECMLAANVCAADFLKRNRHPGLYRVHEGPTPEKLAVLRTYLKSLNVPLQLGEEPTPADYQRLADAARERADATQVSMLMLRSMQQAIYSPHNVGHFGLAYAAYTHFTSPIRRYPDLLTHRAIKAVLQSQHYALDVPEGFTLNLPPPPRGAAPKKVRTAAALAEWERVGQHCSANERRADEATRDVESWLKCWYMRDKLGEEYVGAVTAVTSFGVFVQLTQLYVEGLIHISELGAEYFRYDEARNELRGERTGKRYALGDRVLVQVSRVDLDARKIDFRLVGEGSTARRRRVADAPPVRDERDDSAFALDAGEVEVSSRAAQPPRGARSGGKSSKAASAVSKAAGKSAQSASGKSPGGKAASGKSTGGKSVRKAASPSDKAARGAKRRTR
jgi:ribonuclease R